MGFDSKTGEVSPLGPLAGATRRDEVAVTACALWLEGIPWYQAISIAKEAYDQADATLDVTKDAYLLPGAHSCVTSLAESGLTLSSLLPMATNAPKTCWIVWEYSGTSIQ